jgi:anti-sigma factor ChrR (cupin superfamily)
MEKTPVITPNGAGASTVNSHISTDDLAELVDGQLSADRQAVVDAHLAVCERCRAELLSAAAIVDSASTAPTRRSSSRWLVAGAAVAAAAVAMLMVLPRATKRDALVPASEREQRGASSATIATVSPGGGAQISRSAVHFTWHGDGRSSYRLILMDSEGTPVFTISTPNTTVVPPDTLRLVGGAHYFWYVDALQPDGSSASTPLNGFTIRQ